MKNKGGRGSKDKKKEKKKEGGGKKSPDLYSNQALQFSRPVP